MDWDLTSAPTMHKEAHPQGWLWRCTLPASLPDEIINDAVVAFHRYGRDENGRLQRFIIVINYSDDDQTINIPFSNNGLWQDLLNDQTDFVQNYRLFQRKTPSNWDRIYYQSE